MATDTLSLLLSLQVQTMGENLLAGLASGLEGLAGNAGNLSGLQSTLAGLGGTLTTVGVSAMAAGAALSAGVVGLASVAGEFDAKLTEVRNNTTMLDGDAQTMRDTILQIGASSPASLNALADGFMHASNMGFSAADAATVLNVAMESAVSTGGDVAKTTELLAQVMHEFKMPATEAAQAMDLMHLAAAEGNMTLEQFTESAGPVMAWAAALGVPLDQVSAAFSTMTRHGFDAARAATQVQDIFVHIIKPSQGAQDALAELAKVSGVDLTDALSATNLNARGLPGILDQIHDAMVKAGMSTEEMTSEWMKLIPNIRGGAAAFVLTGQGTEDFKNILHDLDTQTGVTSAAYDRMKATLPFEWGVLKNQVSELAISLGGAFLPAVQQIVTNIGPLLTQFANWVSAHKDLIAQVVPLAAALLLVGGAVVTIVGVVALLVAALNPVSLIILGVIAVVTALGVAWSQNFLGMQDTVASVVAFVQSAWPRVVETVQDGMAAVQSVIQSVLGFVSPFVESELAKITGWWTANHALIQQTVDTVMGVVNALITASLQAISTVVSVTLDMISGFWATFGSSILDAAAFTWDALKVIIDSTIHVILDLITLTMQLITGNWAGAWATVQDIFQTQVTALVTIAQNLWARIGPSVTALATSLVVTLQGAWTSVQDAVNAASASVVATVSGAWTSVTTSIASALAGVQATVAGAWASVTGTTTGAVTTEQSIIQAGMTAVAGLVQGAMNTVVGAFQWMFDHNYYFEDLVTFIRQTWTTITTDATSDWNAVTTFLTQTWQTISSAVTATWSTISTFFSTTWTTIQTTITTALTSIATFLSTQWTAINALVTTTWNTIATFFQTTWTKIQTTISTTLTTIQNTVINPAWKAITDEATKIWNAIVKQITDAWDSITGAITTAAPKVEAAAQSIWDAIRTAADTLIKDAFSWGANLVQGIIDGLNSKLQALKDAAASVAAAAAAALGFHSPTEYGPGKDADTWGPNLVTMMATGMVQTAPVVQSAAATVASVANPSLVTASAMAPGSPTSLTMSPNLASNGSSVTVVLTGNQFMGSLTESDVAYWGDKLSRYLNQQFGLYGQHA